MVDAKKAIGRAPDALSPAEREELAGKVVALEIYTPQTLPFQRIEAIGDSVEECLRELARRGLEPAQFEFQRLKGPF